MAPPWRIVPVFLLISSALASSHSFENTAIVRTIDLGGSIVHVTTTYAIKALEDGLKTYTVALGKEEKAKTSWVEVTVKGDNKPLSILEHGIDDKKDTHLIDVQLPRTLSVNKTLNIVVESIQTHATWPWPATAAQTEDQALKYSTDLFVVSPYNTAIQRTKVKALTPRVIHFTEPKNVESFVKESAASKSGATVTYGPFENIPPSNSAAFLNEYQQPIVVHYHHDQPVIEVLSLKRAVEISHWGNNLNTQDEMTLFNAGPKLKGHFSRLAHQTQTYYKRNSPHVLPALTLLLPPGIQDTYYYDIIGNVSTSKLRVAPSVPKDKKGTAFSVFEFRPRYPLLGGWNYSFTLGYDAPLGDYASYDKSTGKYNVEVPIMTVVTGAVVNEEELTVILPEGATDVEFIAPFPAESNWIGTHTTFLDTTGRPYLTFVYKNLTPLHAQSIYVSYKVSWSAHFKKPVAVATAFLGLFALAMMARRVNLTLHQEKRKL